jgi:diaminopropionate ammonia-lyase
VASLVSAFVAIEDDFAFQAMRMLARPAPPDPVIECGPSGAAALGGLLATRSDRALAPVNEALNIGLTSSVLVIATEGVTDPALFAAVLARP